MCVRFVVDKVVKGQVYLLVLRFSTSAPQSPSSTCCFHQKYKRAKPGNLSKSNALVEIGEHWLEKYFHLVFSPAATADRRIGNNHHLRTARRPVTVRKTSSITCNKHRKLNRNGALSLHYAMA